MALQIVSKKTQKHSRSIQEWYQTELKFTWRNSETNLNMPRHSEIEGQLEFLLLPWEIIGIVVIIMGKGIFSQIFVKTSTHCCCQAVVICCNLSSHGALRKNIFIKHNDVRRFKKVKNKTTVSRIHKAKLLHVELFSFHYWMKKSKSIPCWN